MQIREQLMARKEDYKDIKQRMKANRDKHGKLKDLSKKENMKGIALGGGGLPAKGPRDKNPRDHEHHHHHHHRGRHNMRDFMETYNELLKQTEHSTAITRERLDDKEKDLGDVQPVIVNPKLSKLSRLQ
jgi:alkylhydroperoxidase/carboxymuconolactone decarboxylase family protein YurZ